MHQQSESLIIGDQCIIKSKTICTLLKLIHLGLSHLDSNQYICTSFTLFKCRSDLRFEPKDDNQQQLLFLSKKIRNTYLSTVVEQTNVPSRTEGIQELHQSTRPFWEHKTTKNLILKV